MSRPGAVAKSAPTLRRVRTRARGALSVWIYAAVGFTVVALVAWWSYEMPSYLQPSFPWWALALVFVMAELLIVHLRFGRDVQSQSMNAVPLVVGLCAVAPIELLAAAAVGAVAAVWVRRRKRFPTLILVVALRLASTAAAMVAFAVAVPSESLVGPVVWLGALAAALVGLAVGRIAEYSLDRVAQRATKPRERLQAFGFAAVVTSLNAALGMLAVHALYVTPVAAPLALVPMVGVFIAYRAYATSRQERTRLKALYEATRDLHESAQVETSMVAAATHARDMFEAQFCEIVLLLGSGAYRTIVGPGNSHSAMEAIDLDRWREVWDRALSTRAPFLLDRPGSLASSAAERRLPIQAAMVAPIAVGGQQIGLMVVANPEGEVGVFAEAELDLLATLAGQVGVAVENGRLEDSLAQLTELKEELKHQALHDELTGLANRTLFREQVFHAMQRTRRTGTRVAVLFLDLDDFKNVNDSLGHVAGDQMLRAVGNRLREYCRPEDTIARLGGDEFGVLLEDISEPSDATAVAQRVLEGLTSTFFVAGRDVSASASIGIAFGAHGDTAVQVLRDADAAMYSAKRDGKAKYRVFESAMHAEVKAQLQLRAELDAVIDKDELRMLYQPIVDLATGSIRGFEGLVRWEHSRKGWLGPGTFVPFAEDSGLIHRIGRWVLWEALRSCQIWQEMLRSDDYEFEVTVNLSAKQLEDPHLVGEVARALMELRIDPALLVLEITETAMMRANPDVLDDLRGLGVRLAIDDFGTGYSSLASLHQLPVDVLKIDRLFVQAMDDDVDGSPFVSTIVGLGRALGLETIVEGIETLDQLERIRELGCSVGQGFYFSRPMQTAEATALLAKQLEWGNTFDLEELAGDQPRRQLKVVG